MSQRAAHSAGVAHSAELKRLQKEAAAAATEAYNLSSLQAALDRERGLRQMAEQSRDAAEAAAVYATDPVRTSEAVSAARAFSETAHAQLIDVSNSYSALAAQLAAVKGGASRAAREHEAQFTELREQWLESQAQLGQARAALKQEREENERPTQS